MSSETRYESLWRNLPAHNRVTFRPAVALGYGNAPFVPTYELQEIAAIDVSVPDDEWLVNRAAEIIRGDPKSTSPLPVDCPVTDRGPLVMIAEPDWNAEFISLERALLRDSRVRFGLARDIAPATVIGHVLADGKLGNSRNRTLIDLATIDAKLRLAQAAQSPLSLVLPAFPFKNRNIFRSGTDASRVELGEIVLLMRLWALATLIADIHPFGAKWIIASDGIVYHEAFGVPRDEAVGYREKLRRWRSRLGMDATIELLELTDLLKAMPSFADLHMGIEKRLRALGMASEVLRERIPVLARGMRKRMDLGAEVEGYGVESTWRALNEGWPDAELSANEGELRRALTERSMDAAMKYVSFNLAMRRAGLYQKLFPEAIRATVHPKPGQVAIPRIGTADPWSGVTLCRNWLSGAPLWSLAEIVPRWDLPEVAGGNVLEVRLEGTDTTLFRAASGAAEPQSAV